MDQACRLYDTEEERRKLMAQASEEMEQAYKTVYKANNIDLTEKVNKSGLKIWQVDMMRCKASCCENRELSADRMTKCVDYCTTPLRHINQYIYDKKQAAQWRFERCDKTCGADVKDLLRSSSSDHDKLKGNLIRAQCLTNCATAHLESLEAACRHIREI